MFTLTVATVDASKATEGENLITSPRAIGTILTLGQMNQYAEKFIGKKFEKGTTKSAACIALFDAIAAKVGYDAAAIQAAKDIEATQLAEAKAAKAKEPKERQPRKAWSKTYLLKIGTIPVIKDGKVEVLWGDHAKVITEAIEKMVGAGKTEATREEIMAEAVAVGLYERRKSTQGVAPIFSWWRKSLFTMGWLDAKPEPVVAPVAAPEAPKA